RLSSVAWGAPTPLPSWRRHHGGQPTLRERGGVWISPPAPDWARRRLRRHYTLLPISVFELVRDHSKKESRSKSLHHCKFDCPRIIEPQPEPLSPQVRKRNASWEKVKPCSGLAWRAAISGLNR